jgi:hypothetical protein
MPDPGHIGPRCRPPDHQPTTTTGHHTTCCNFAVLHSWWWTNVCPKHVELILKINKYCYLLHLVGLGFITLPKIFFIYCFLCACLTSAHSILSLFNYPYSSRWWGHCELLVTLSSMFLCCLFCFKSMYFSHHCLGKNEPHVFLSMYVFSTGLVACVYVCLCLLFQCFNIF